MPHLLDNISIVGCGSWHGMTAYSKGVAANSFLLDAGDEMALIDPGLPEGVPDVLTNIRALGKDPRRIKKILLTHAHDDHTAGLAEMLKHVHADAVVFGHRLTRETLAGERGIYHPDFLPRGHVNGPVHEIVKEGDTVHVGRIELKVWEFPGHTPDGIGFALPLSVGPACLIGDSLIGDQPMRQGVIGWLDWHWGSKLTDYRRTLQRIREMNLCAFFGGHGNAHLTRASCESSAHHALEGLERLMAVPNLDWLIAMDM